MLRGLTTAASGMTADERLQQMLANNLANAQTPGFKASTGEMLEFPRQWLERIPYGGDAGTPVGETGTGVVLQEGGGFGGAVML
ncbi:MAG: flagellar basal body protein, partial [Alicyclobacillus sp.]|nr:flagellar basal body protein [Alicyclobacillus sp.]